MASGADHERLASFTRHELRPWRLWLPRFAEVGEFADVVDFHLAGVLAHLASSCPEPLDQLGAADDESRTFRDGFRRLPSALGTACHLPAPKFSGHFPERGQEDFRKP